MAAEFVVTVSKKRRVEEPEFLTNTCVLCGAPFSAKDPATTPDLTKIHSLFAACSERKDEVGLRLLAKQSSIHDGSVTIRYHRHCRSTYTSKLHLKRNADKQVKTGETQSSSSEYNRTTRSSLPLNTFDWKKNCFLCGAECNPKKRASWSMVQSAIGKKSDKSDMYTCLLYTSPSPRDS